MCRQEFLRWDATAPLNHIEVASRIDNLTKTVTALTTLTGAIMALATALFALFAKLAPTHAR
jgi:hypothetical protein